MQRLDDSDDHWRIRVRLPAPLPFQPGQYATLGISTDGRLVERPYSIVSAPSDAELEFYLELVPNGQLTPLLHRLQVGDTLTVRATAKGRFLFDTGSGRTNHLLLCTATGIAPYVSFVRSRLGGEAHGPSAGLHRLFVIQGASRSAQFGYREEMLRIAHGVPWLTYVPTVSRPWDDPQWSGETGRVDDILRKYTDQWQLDGHTTTAYLCGHPEMIEHGRDILRRRGWPGAALRTETYVPSRRRIEPA